MIFGHPTLGAGRAWKRGGTAARVHNDRLTLRRRLAAPQIRIVCAISMIQGGNLAGIRRLLLPSWIVSGARWEWRQLSTESSPPLQYDSMRNQWNGHKGFGYSCSKERNQCQ
jgi:hypothetical protein